MNLEKELKKVAIIITFNDIQKFNGGSRVGLKEKISYFDQFLILYESICDNWKKEKFDYEFYILHSIPFKPNKLKIIKSLPMVNVQMVSYPKHKHKIRPMAYYLDVDCDYKLVLDVDMLALKEPDFDFTSDAQGMYGGNKYNSLQWKKICNFLKCHFPEDLIVKTDLGHYRKFEIKEHFLYHTTPDLPKMFPYFNNGAILIKNTLSQKLAEVWDGYRDTFTEFIFKEFNTNIDLEGQDVIGLAIHKVTKNWTPFERGFNFILQDKFDEGRELVDIYKGNVSLIHYVNVPQNTIYYPIVLNYYNQVKNKYYSTTDLFFDDLYQKSYRAIQKVKKHISKLKKSLKR